MVDNSISSNSDMSKLEWLSDFSFKIDRIQESISNSIWYDSKVLGQEHNFSYREDYLEQFEEMESNIDEVLQKCIQSHPSWSWLSQLKGIKPTIMCRILGNIRFWPPAQNSLNANTGKIRWAHTRGALLMYCGLGFVDNGKGGKKPQNFKKGQNRDANYKLREYIFEQVNWFLVEKNRYFDFYNDECEFLRNKYSSNKNIEDMGVRSTAVLFMTHLWDITQQELGIEIPENTDKFHKPEYSDPWKMIRN